MTSEKAMPKCILVLCLLVANPADAQKRPSVSGRVLDQTEKAIAGVDVQVYRDNRSVGRSVSDMNGRYSIEYGEGKPIDTVRFDHSDWFPGTVEDISGRSSHAINKILYNRNQRNLTYYQMQEVLSALERIAEIDRQNGSTRQTLGDYRYQMALEAIEQLDLPPDLRAKIAVIKRKYGIQ